MRTSLVTPNFATHPYGRFLAILLAFFLVRGVIYAAITPPWQAPDEPLHYEYVRLLAEERWLVNATDKDPRLEAAIVGSMYQFGWTRYHPGTGGEVAPTTFASVPQIAGVPPQIGRQPPLYYGLGAVVLNLVSNPNVDAQLFAIRLLSVVLAAIGVGISFFIARLLFPSDPLLVLTIPAVLSLLPMRTFIAGSVTNDNLAELLASAFFLALVWAVRSGISIPSALALTISGGAALLTKTTTYFIAMVLALLGLSVVWGRFRLLPLAIQLAATLLALALTFLGFSATLSGDGGGPAAWLLQGLPSVGTRVNRQSLHGSFSLYVANSGGGSGHVDQAMDSQVLQKLRGQPLTLGVWVRTDAEKALGHLQMYDGTRYYGWTFEADREWKYQSLQETITPSATMLWVTLAGRPGQAAIYYDGAALAPGALRGEPRFDDSSATGGNWDGQPFRNLLRNGSAESGKWGPRPWFRRWLETLGVSADIVTTLLDPDYFGPAAQKVYQQRLWLTFRSYWGLFGWMRIGFEQPVYSILGLLTGAGMIGALLALAQRGPIPMVLAAWQKKVLLLFLISTVFSLLVALGRGAPVLFDSNSAPQGRYLFPVNIPLMTLLCLGLYTLVPLSLRKGWSVFLIGGMVLLDSVSLTNYIIPFFYG